MRPMRWLAAAALVCAAGTGGAAHAKDEAADALDALKLAADSATRLGIIRRLGATKSDRAAEALERTARHDDDPKVRIAAAKALTSMNCDTALPSLEELLAAGGIREVRRQAALGVAARPHGLERTMKRIRGRETETVERLLLVSALGDFPGIDAGEALEHLAASDDVGLRCTALRAMSRQAFGRAELGHVAADLIARTTDAETALAALDACDGVADRELRDVLPDLDSRKDARISAAARYAARRIAYLDVSDERDAAAKANEKRLREGYAPVAPPPLPEPSLPSRARVDSVLVYDATGSMTVGVHSRRVEGLEEAAREESVRATSYRHAWVAVHDTPREAWDPVSTYFPALFDSSVLRDVRWRLTAASVDTQGIDVGVVLREVLDRFEWRPGAERRIRVVSDNYVGDPEIAIRALHAHQADGLTFSFTLAGTTPRDYADSWTPLIVAAGGFVPERKK